MQTIHLVMHAYQRAPLIEAAIKRLFDKTDMQGLHTKLHVFDFGYPLPSAGENSAKIKAFMAGKHMPPVLCKNESVSGNYDTSTRIIAPADEDILAYFDPDSNPSSETWLKSAIRVLTETGGAYCTLSRKVTDAVQKSPIIDIEGVRCQRLTRSCGWPMGIFAGHFVNRVKQFGLPQKYGYFENHLLALMASQQKNGYIIRSEVDTGYIDIASEYDPEYTSWKIKWAHNQTTLSFEDYLAARSS